MDYRWVTPVTDTPVSAPTRFSERRNVPKTTSTPLGNNPRIVEVDAGEEDVQEDKEDDEGNTHMRDRSETMLNLETQRYMCIFFMRHK